MDRKPLIRRIGASLVSRDVIGALLILGPLLSAGGQCAAQALTTPDSARLTVRPRTMATATQTSEAGEFPLDSFRPGSTVYVPPTCVGQRRCPLLVAMEGGSRYLRPVADKYGIIMLLIPTSTGNEVVTSESIGALGASLKYVLQTFAVDPDKIAVMGNCHSGPPALFLGGLNLDVFSRVIAFSGSTLPPAGMDPRNTTTEFLIGSGFHESGSDFTAVEAWRRAGHPVTHLLSIKAHGNNRNEYDFMGRWLQQSWAVPAPAARPTLPMVANPLPVLTADALTHFVQFWTSFMQEPASIRTTWNIYMNPDSTMLRQTELHEVSLPVGHERASVWMTDMSALAARYPSVAADLKNAGLTAEQHDAYRLALLSAMTTQSVNAQAGDVLGAAQFQALAQSFGAPPLADPTPVALPVDSASVLGRNMAFLEAHQDELSALETLQVWDTP